MTGRLPLDRQGFLVHFKGKKNIILEMVDSCNIQYCNKHDIRFIFFLADRSFNVKTKFILSLESSCQVASLECEVANLVQHNSSLGMDAQVWLPGFLERLDIV